MRSRQFFAVNFQNCIRNQAERKTKFHYPVRGARHEICSSITSSSEEKSKIRKYFYAPDCSTRYVRRSIFFDRRDVNVLRNVTLYTNSLNFRDRRHKIKIAPLLVLKVQSSTHTSMFNGRTYLSIWRCSPTVSIAVCTSFLHLFMSLTVFGIREEGISRCFNNSITILLLCSCNWNWTNRKISQLTFGLDRPQNVLTKPDSCIRHS